MYNNQKFNQLIYQLKNLIDKEKSDNKVQKGNIINISGDHLEISLQEPLNLSKNTLIEINRVEAKIIELKNKNLLVEIKDNHIFKENQEVSIHNIQKDIIIKKLNELEINIEDNRINKSNKETLDVILDYVNPTFTDKKYNIKNLNKNQKKAVNRALSSNKFHIIQGPPGTGKTHSIVEIIKQLYHDNKKILITTHTHIALDNILEKLDTIPDNKILRIGNDNKISKQSKKYVIDEHIKRDPEYEKIEKRNKEIEELKQNSHELNKEQYIPMDNQDDNESYLSRILRKIMNYDKNEENLKQNIDNLNSTKNINRINELNMEKSKIKENIQSNLLKNIPIIASTVLSSSSYLTKDLEFDYVIMDEASQVPIYLALIPLMKTDKFILIGDDKQLQPISNSNASLFLNKSIFNHLIKKYPTNFTFLNIQYRMNKKISDISSILYYSNQLKTFHEIKDQKITIKDNSNILLNNEPVTFIDTSGMDYNESPISNGCCNKYEAMLILNITKSLLNNKISEKEIGIITPYRKQKIYLQKLFQKEHIQSEIDTIYRFQGREKDVIIMDFCKSFNGSLTKFQENFLADENQLNVSITRSRKKLIMIGDISVLSRAVNIKNLLYQISPLNIIYLKDFL